AATSSGSAAVPCCSSVGSCSSASPWPARRLPSSSSSQASCSWASAAPSPSLHHRRSRPGPSAARSSTRRPVASRSGLARRAAAEPNVSTLPLLALAFGGAAATLLARRWPDASTAIGLAGLVAAFVAASGIVPGDEIPIAGGALVGSAYARLFLQLGAGIGLVLTMAGRLALGPGWPAYLPGALLAGLGAACLGLTVRDTTTAIVATIGGGLAGWLLTAPAPASDRTVAR